MKSIRLILALALTAGFNGAFCADESKGSSLGVEGIVSFGVPGSISNVQQAIALAQVAASDAEEAFLAAAALCTNLSSDGNCLNIDEVKVASFFPADSKAVTYYLKKIVQPGASSDEKRDALRLITKAVELQSAGRGETLLMYAASQDINDLIDELVNTVGVDINQETTSNIEFERPYKALDYARHGGQSDAAANLVARDAEFNVASELQSFAPIL